LQTNIKFAIFAGCDVHFERVLGIQVNNGMPIPVKFECRWANQMPIATLINVNRKSLYEIDKTFEYECLRDLFVRMTNANYSSEPMSGADNVIEIISPKEFHLCYSENGKALWCEKPHRIYGEIVVNEEDEAEFLALEHNNEFHPCGIEITNFIAQQGFVKSLIENEIVMEYESIYKRYVRSDKNQNNCMLVKSLPLILPEYTIDLGGIEMGEMCEKNVEIYFHQKDFVHAALTSETFTPDFRVEFLDNFKLKNSFKIINSTIKKPKVNCVVKRCHSFDFIEGKVHSRKILKGQKQRNELFEVYNKFSSTKDEKNPFTFADIHQTTPLADEIKRMIEFKISFRPMQENYNYSEIYNFNEIIYLEVSIKFTIIII
jgi:hypothetical protein